MRPSISRKKFEERRETGEPVSAVGDLERGRKIREPALTAALLLFWSNY